MSPKDLTSQQRQAIARWVGAGDGLSTVQRRLAEEFQLALTYMDVRFLVDDLDLKLKDAPAPKPTPDLQKPAAPPPASPDADAGLDPEPEVEDLEPAGGSVTLDVDTITRPGTVVSGGVTFSDGQTAKWAVDQYGRLLFEPAKRGYRPTNEDLQAFQMELDRALQRKGL